MKMIPLNLTVSTSDFDLEKAVCNHGFFMMPPNKWVPSSKTLQRPLRLSNSNSSVLVSINQPSSFLLTIQVHSPRSISPQDQQTILDQVVRMLRITEKDEHNVREFQNLHPTAKEMGFGRIFRSPTLFEDAVKSILLCNTSWRRTLAMAGQLCELQAQQMSQTSRKRKRRENDEGGNFPNALELSKMSVELLKKHLLGYRAGYLIKFAKSVQNKRIDLQKLELELELELDEDAACSRIATQFLKIKGFGPFAIANIFMCLGFYHRLPTDTETIRHLKQVHGREVCSKKTVEEDVKQIYNKYAPFQCLVYWFELVEYYETKFGKLSELCSHDYHKISGTTLKL